MRGTALISDHSLKGLERSILVAGSLTLCVTVFLLISTVFNQFKVSEAKAKLEVAKQQIATLTTTLERAKKIDRKPNTAKELGIVQVAMNRLAKENKCQLLEMSSTSDAIAFTSKYQKGGDDHGWKQLPLDCQIAGSLVSVMTMVRQFATLPIPIEIQSMDIAPLDKTAQGNERVTVKVTFQLIKQEAGA